MNAVSKLYYEIKVVGGGVMLLPFLLLPFLALHAWQFLNPEFLSPLARMHSVFQACLPLVAGLIVSHVLSVEREEQFDSLRHALPEATWQPIAYRIVIGMGALVISASIAAGIFYYAFEEFTLLDELQSALPAMLLLMAVSMLANNVAGNYWVSMGVVVVYWMLEFATKGKYTGIFYLFQPLYPRPDFNETLNVLALLTTTVLLIGMIFFSRYAQRRGYIT